MESNRRNFIQTLSLVGGGLLFFPACSEVKSAWRFFSEAESNVIIAIAEQIVPADQDPGATDAGVVNFIDKQLVGFYLHHQSTYRKGLAALQQYCLDHHHKLFEWLEWELQTDVLKLMENDKMKGEFWKDNPPSVFFKLLRDHSMQGFYGSPRHGGNKDFVSYKMIKLDYPQIIGQNRYTPRNETLNIHKK